MIVFTESKNLRCYAKSKDVGMYLNMKEVCIVRITVIGGYIIHTYHTMVHGVHTLQRVTREPRGKPLPHTKASKDRHLAVAAEGM